MSDSRRPSPSDLSDAEWELLAPLLAPLSRCGRPRKWPVRHVADAIFSALRSGCAWRRCPPGGMPRHFPPWQRVSYHFRHWHRQGTLRRAHDQLRGRIRARGGRDERPSGAVIDRRRRGRPRARRRWRQATRPAQARVPRGRILVATTGVSLGAKVHRANLHDRDGGRHLPSAGVGEALPRLALIWADAGYAGEFGRWVDRERG